MRNPTSTKSGPGRRHKDGERRSRKPRRRKGGIAEALRNYFQNKRAAAYVAKAVKAARRVASLEQAA